MISRLPINLDDLLNRRNIEGTRIEYKAAWDENIKRAVVRTVCAYANDLLNLNGGYVILGVEEEGGYPILPPLGLDQSDVDEVQRLLMGACRQIIAPEYLPRFYVESFEGKTLLVVWAPAGDNRPYEAYSHYWVRPSSETIQATGDLRRQLLEQTAKIPYDDRRSLTGTVEDISVALVKRFLRDVRSHLALMDLGAPELYRQLRLTVPVNDHDIPRNVSLLFFNEDPGPFFPGTRAYIEVVQFGNDAGGDLIEEKTFRGTLPDQIRSCLNYLDGLGGTLIRKMPGQAEVERTVPYPYEAMEEAIVNAVYHRSYEAPPEPIKVYMYPDRMEIASHPGPVPGIQPEHLKEGRIPPVPARNRRIGELLKELRLAEGRGTGIPKILRRMRENGSPEAHFDFDDARSYFRVILPVHPRYQALHALRESAHLWAVGEKDQAIRHLERAFDLQQGSGALASQLIEYAFIHERMELAQRVLDQFDRQETRSEASSPYLTMARLLVDRERPEEARRILRRAPTTRTVNELIEAAILQKRLRHSQESHRLFAEAYAMNPDDPKIIHEFAQVKMIPAGSSSQEVRARLNRQAEELLRRAIQLARDNPTRLAWCWRDLARVLDYLRAPKSEVEEAFLNARSLLPEESRFQREYEDWKGRSDVRR